MPSPLREKEKEPRMTKPRDPRRAAQHPDDERWATRDLARSKRRLFAKFVERWTPEMREAYRRQQAERADAQGRRERP